MKKRGKGIGCVIYQTHPPLPNPTAASVEILHDGTVRLGVGSSDIGQGSNTVLCQIAAETLGVPIEFINLQTADTEHAPYCVGTYGTRLTYVAGQAVRLAALEAKKILLEAAAVLLGAQAEVLEIREGKILNPEAPDKAIPMSDVCGYAYFMHGKIPIGTASFSPEIQPLDPETGQGKASAAYIFGVHVAEVEVDLETGEIEVLKITAAHDIGKAINPQLAEGQVEGGIQMGLGYALMEEIVDDNRGCSQNPNLTDYLLPTAMDVPKIETIFVETNEPTGPFGAKGLGESTTCPTAPAIINAIQDAAGVWIRNLPATPEKVLSAIKEKALKGE
jgi:CO/xanthine dehydrogenase Mo-binding subunit